MRRRSLFFLGMIALLAISQQPDLAWAQSYAVRLWNTSSHAVIDHATAGPGGVAIFPLTTLSSPHWLMSYKAEAGQGYIKLYHWTRDANTNTIGPHKELSGGMTFTDLVFTSSLGNPTVDVSLNLFVGGTIAHEGPGGICSYARVTVTLNGTNVGLGQWSPDLTTCVGSSGAFTSSTGNSLNSVYTTGVLTVPTGVPISFTVSALVNSASGNAGGAIAECNFYDTIKFAHQGVGPVFNFPNPAPGDVITANSLQADITDNVWRETVSVESTTWEAVKKMYRD